MYRTFLLLLGLLFLGVALLGSGYLYLLGKPQELHALIDNNPLVGSPPTSTEMVSAIEPTDTISAAEPTSTSAPATSTPPDTPTPLDTATPSPTATIAATEISIQPQTYCIQTGSSRPVVVRSGPGATYPQLGKPLPVGTCLLFSARNEESTWLLIASNQPDRNLQPYEGGWLPRELLGLGSSGPIPLPAVTLTPTRLPPIFIIPTLTPTHFIILRDIPNPALSFKPVSFPNGISLAESQPEDMAPSDNFRIEANWPSSMEVGGSGTIRVALVKTDQGYVPTVEITGKTPVVFTPIAVGTPGQDLNAAFGEGYRAKRAVAKIAGASFDIQPVLPAESQLLDEPQIVWTWSISSDTVAKDQAVELTIQIEWERVGDPSDIKNPVVWREHMDIDVFQPFLKAGQVSALNVVAAFLGSGLSIPWLYERISKRKPQPRRKPKKPS